MIGMGVGFIAGNVPAFMFIGIGCGLVVAAMLKVLASQKEQNDKEEES
jgi:H+/Cl- antiporter ClcA